MILPDVNVLLYAHREESPSHVEYRRWLEGAIGGDQAYAMSELVLSAFVRIATHPRIFDPPSSLEDALAFAHDVLDRINCVVVTPGRRHFAIFERLCREVGARGNLIPDAYLAALAIENGCEWISTDRDFSRFDGLRWAHPLRQTTP